MPSHAQDTTYVDLGLSVKWGTCNLGANSPEEYGDYYAWGEIETKEKYDWSTYKWCEGDFDKLTKYCVKTEFGMNTEFCKVDNKSTLELEDDAAHVKLGGSWRIPTVEELVELDKYCDSEWTAIKGIKGCKLTSTINGNSIFLPAAGAIVDTDITDQGKECTYWASTLVVEDCRCTYECAYYASTPFCFYDPLPFRCYGHPIRPVRK